MQMLQLIGEIGNQAADIARTQGDIAGFTAAKAEHPTYTDDQLRETKEFKQASEPFGTGGAIQQAITASTAAIQGLAGGDIAKALAGGAAPYLATVIKKTVGEDNKAANLMAHAVVNAALSLAKGENALAGASSAVTAEAVGMISKAYYGKDPSELDESQKQTISALASLAAGLAGGLVGGDTASTVSGMQTGKVTVENNSLGDNKPGHDDDELKREHGDRELKVISMKPWTGSLLDDNGNPIPGAYKAGIVIPATGKGTTGSLSGQPTKLPPNASPENIRSLQRENEGATILSKNGYHVEQNPVTAGVKNPDYKINGEVFDNIAPKTNSVRNIYDRALEKVNSGQTNNVVINLADTKASISDLQKQFNDWPIKGLDKVIAIDQSGNPIRIK